MLRTPSDWCRSLPNPAQFWYHGLVSTGQRTKFQCLEFHRNGTNASKLLIAILSANILHWGLVSVGVR